METESKFTPGLIDIISQSMSETEIKNTIAKGKAEYKYASPKTIRRWGYVAKRRMRELDTTEVSPKTEKKKDVKK
jgi:hypothetical protein